MGSFGNKLNFAVFLWTLKATAFFWFILISFDRAVSDTDVGVKASVSFSSICSYLFIYFFLFRMSPGGPSFSSAFMFDVCFRRLIFMK